jgi:DNA mismatch endonuclease (patch repair protein)
LPERLRNSSQPTRLRTDTPLPSSEEASRRMKAVRQRDTDIEVALRSEVHRLGLRFRINQPPLPGIRRRADLVFRSCRVAVYVDGCFWHMCPLHASWPKSNADWWRKKIEDNQRRDLDTDSCLHAAGWTVIRVWGHEDPAEAAARVADAVRKTRPSRLPR